MEWASILGRRTEFATYGLNYTGTAHTTANAGGSNAKGGWTRIGGPTVSDSYGFILNIYTDGKSDVVIDVSTQSGTAGIFLPNLLISAPSTICDQMFFPVFVPAGSEIWIRGQASLSNRGVLASFMTVAPDSLNIMPVFNRCTDYGVDLDNSGGTLIDPSGSANTWSAWREMVASTSYPIEQMAMLVGDLSNSIMASGFYLVQIGVGSAGNEVPIFTATMFSNINDDTFAPRYISPILVSLPEGVRLSVRGQTQITDATDRLMSVSVYGFD